jgi:protein gp37
MGKTTIEWTDYSWNPWTGCTKVSPGCDNCYAEGWAKRSGLVKWGAGQDRRRTSADYWRQPIKWNRIAERDGVRRKVFCASLADVFDNAVPESWRDDLWALIDTTPHLDWLLLTKRPQNIKSMMPAEWLECWPNGVPNIWLGTTAENQQEADRRIPHLLAVPARVRFLSCEPLLGPLDLTAIRTSLPSDFGVARTVNALTGAEGHIGPFGPTLTGRTGPRIGWVIAGGESGHGARSMHPAWVRGLRDQCTAVGAGFFFKQWGEWAPSTPEEAAGNPRSGWRILRGHPAVAKAAELYPEAGAAFIAHVGKKAAGHLLDGVEWRQFPSAAR